MLKMKKMLKNQQGFTLVELLVVIAIIAVLAAVVTPNVFKAVDKSKVSAAIAEYDAIKTAVITYHADTGVWPTAGDDLVGLDENGKNKANEDVNNWNGPYLDRFPKENAWGGEISLEGNSANSEAGIEDGDIVIKLVNLPDDTIADSLEKQLDKSNTDDTGIDKSGIVRYPSDKSTVYLVIVENNN